MVRSIAGDEVHVWRLALENGSDPGVLARDLSEDERGRAEHLKYPQDRARFVRARSWLRRLLGSYLGVAACDVQFGYGAHGKPELADRHAGSGLVFNMAHSHGLGLVAIGRRQAIGIDVEQVRPFPGAGRIAARFFSRQERALLESAPDGGLPAAFFAIWTCKEAFIKGLGEGLAYPLASFSVLFDPVGAARLDAAGAGPDATAGWSLQSIAPADGYVGAVAASGPMTVRDCGEWPAAGPGPSGLRP